MAEQRMTGRASIELPMEEWDWDNLTELQKVVWGRTESVDLDEVVDEVRRDPSLAQFRWGECQWTLLHEAANHQHEPLVRALVEAGADLNTVGSCCTPLIEAGGDLQLVELLLAKGADPNGRDSSANTPLREALRHGQFDMVKLLLAYGAVPQEEYSQSLFQRFRQHGLL